MRLSDLLAERRSTGRGVGAFNVILLEHAEAIVAGAERAGLPVVLQISENCVKYHGRLAPITRAALEIARAADVDVFVHLDHIENPTLVDEGLALGVDSIMYDGSRLPYQKNVAMTHRVATRCHIAGTTIEAELGEIGGKDGVHAQGARTDPAEAIAFINATGIDALAVAVGTSHAMQTKVAVVDRSLISRLHDAVAAPLVLHGSSGLSDQELRGAVEAGMTKINISTHLNQVFTRAIRTALSQAPEVVDPRRYVTAGREAISDEVFRLLTLLASND